MTDDDEPSNGTVQKKLNIRASYASALEDMAEDLYGSKYKQARVIEDLIDLTQYEPLSTKTEDILQTPNHHGTVLREDVEDELDIEGENSDEDPVHKEDQLSTDFEESKDSEPLEERLSRMKGSRNLDRGAIVEEVAEEMLPPAFTKGMLVEVLQNEAEYGRSGAYNVLKEANLYEFPLDEKSLNRWARAKARQTEAEFETFAEFAGIDPDEIPYEKLYSAQEAVERAVTEVVVEIETEGHPARRDAALEKIREEAGKYL